MGGGLPHLGHHEAAEQAGGVLAQDALGDPDEADAAVEDLAHVEAGVGAADDLADEVAQEERPQLVHQRPDDLGPAGLAHRFVGVPEPAEADGVVGDGGDHRGPERVVGEEAGDVGQAGRDAGGRGVAEQGEAGGAEHVVGAGSPEGGEDRAEDPDQVVDGEVGVGPRQDVQDRGGVGVLGVDEHGAGLGAGGEPVAEVGDQVALGVDDHHPAPGVDVGEDEVGEQRRLA